jgi:hypothetical protein
VPCRRRNESYKMTRVKAPRNALAIAAGILMALGYIALGDPGTDAHGRRVFVGLLFGITQTLSMIFKPARFTPRLVGFATIPLLLVLIIHQALNKTPLEVALVAAFAVAFVLVQFAFATSRR